MVYEKINEFTIKKNYVHKKLFSRLKNANVVICKILGHISICSKNKILR